MYLNPLAISLYGVALAGLVYGIWRLRQFRRNDQRPTPGFAMFWCWPVCWLVFDQVVPGYRAPDRAFDLVHLVILVLGLLDGIYDYGRVRRPSRGQWLSCLLLVPLLLWYFHADLGGPRTALVMPHHGKALVWTEGFWSPHRYYFIRTEAAPAAAMELDPNDGRPIFAVMNGTVTELARGMLVIRQDETCVALGPFVPDSVRVKVGESVFANQPLGLLDQTRGIPGICLEIREGRIAFADVLAGRLFPRYYERLLPNRNQYVSSASPTRWQME